MSKVRTTGFKKNEFIEKGLKNFLVIFARYLIN